MSTGTPTNFLDLQAGFYNAFAQGLGFSPSDPFQLIQPSPSIVGGDDADQDLWNTFNMIPPLSLTHNTQLSGGNQFLADYQAVLSALQAAPNNFESAIGSSCFDAYTADVTSGKVKAGDPLAFRNWALLNAPCSGCAVQGASALAAAMLDPIFAAQVNVLPYKPAGDQDVTFVPGYSIMSTQLKQAPSRTMSVVTDQWDWNVSNSWTSGSTDGFFGLWGGSDSTSTISQQFASSGVTLTASFGNVLPFAVTPGDWYSSAALGVALNNPTGAPWIAGNPITWNTTFGLKGNMQRFLPALVIVRNMDVTVTSLATYSQSDQTTINNQSSAGLWPFYCQGSGSSTSTNVGFNDSGQMTVRITSAPEAAIVVGCTVMTAAQYLGDEQERSRLIMASHGKKPR